MRKFALSGTIAATLAASVLIAVASADGKSAVTTIHLYGHDTSQANVDLSDPGNSPADQFVFAGDTFNHKGGSKIGRFGGVFTTLSTTAPGEVLAVVNFSLPGGQISAQALFVVSQLSAGKTLTFPITGGTGKYRHARGHGTVQVPPDIPNRTDANFVLRLR